MLDRHLDSILAALLLALLIALHAFSAIFFQLGHSVWPFLVRGPRDHTNPRDGEPRDGGEFAFEHAIEAYERVIDSAYAQRRA